MTNFALSLNRRITVKQLDASVDAIGQPIQAWVDRCTLWANVRFLSGMESVKANAAAAVSRASIRIRYRTDITESMRVVYSGVEFEIRSVLPDEVMRQHVDLVCEVVK